MKNKGVTIIELIITLFVLSIGVVGALSAMRQPIEHTSVSISTFRAYYFAKEGIEIVRNERDRAWIREEEWDKNSLQMRTNHLNADPIQGTRFKRELFLEEVAFGDGNSKIEVTVKVSWTEKEKDYEVNVQENLYDWL
ncbi:MAG: prepilin-type N-terminal cleavage/methylation domain-containing protein [Candidatus Paceibacterota bacterium]